jgi:hypothetical protein
MVAPFVEGFLAKSFSPSVNQGIVLLGKNNLDLRTRGSQKIKTGWWFSPS